MIDEYWIILECRRWKYIPWFRERDIFSKRCEYDDMREFIESLQKEFPDYTIRMGVTRGNDIYLL